MPYFGGKAQDGVYQAIINQIPAHKVYIEPFIGGGAIMIKKRQAIINIGLDIDVSPLLTFPDRVNLLLINKSFFDYFGSVTVKNDFMVPKAASEDIFNFTGSGFRYRMGVKNYKRSDVFIYCDPPYPLSTRGKTRYKFDFTNANQLRFLKMVNKMNCNVAISTYPNILYSEMLKDWRMVVYYSTDRSGKVRKENLFMNYSEPEILHDDQYIGDNSCERQGIKRKIHRNIRKISDWTSRERIKFLRNLLNGLPEFEREYLLSTIDEKNYTAR